MSKRILIVVDMQNDFIDGSLGTAEAQKIVIKVQNKILEYRKRGDEVIFTQDTHYEDYLKTNEGRNLPVEHCIKGTKGWKISDALEIAESSCIEKESFGWMHWDELLPEDVEIIELVGLCTDICVVSNALILKATYPELEISVDAACCAGATVETHQAALKTMKMCQIQIINEDTAL